MDRVIKQAIAQVLSIIYEKQFSPNSYGFRPGRGAHQALRKCMDYANEWYVYAVDMDLEKFFDTVNQSKFIEVLSRTVKDGRIKLGVNKYKAWEFANTRKVSWHIANSPILSSYVTNDRLRRSGYIIFSDYYRKVANVN